MRVIEGRKNKKVRWNEGRGSSSSKEKAVEEKWG